MALYSANGVKRTIDIQATLNSEDALILKTELPNASPFGWTSADLSSVKDLATWVDAAMKAATSAEENSKYIEASVAYFDASKADIDDKLGKATAQYNQMDSLNKEYVANQNSWLTMFQQITDMNASITQMYNEIKEIHNRVVPPEGDPNGE